MTSPDTQEQFIPAGIRTRIAYHLGVVLGRSRVLGPELSEHYDIVLGRAPGIELSEHYDIRFPNMHQAMAFNRYMSSHVELAEPAASLHKPVVLRVRIPGSFDENRNPGQ